MVRQSGFLSVRVRAITSYLLVSLIGAVVGVAVAQDRLPGQLDAACASRCVASGDDAGSCERLCWIPDVPTRVRPDEVTDAVCLRTCLEKGGRYSDCKPRCRMPEAK
jgi:hypothetical protein